LLHGHPPTALEKDQSFTLKLKKLAVSLGKALRIELGLGASLQACIKTLRDYARTCDAQCAEPIRPT
jgi:transposase